MPEVSADGFQSRTEEATPTDARYFSEWWLRRSTTLVQNRNSLSSNIATSTFRPTDTPRCTCVGCENFVWQKQHQEGASQKQHTLSSISASASAAVDAPLSALARLAARAFAAASAEGLGRGQGALWRYSGSWYACDPSPCRMPLSASAGGDGGDEELASAAGWSG